MLYFYKNPSWIDPRVLQENKLEEIPSSFFDEINRGLTSLQSDSPLVSVVIPAYNEESSILRTVWSLSRSKTEFPVEVIVVNNNSTDRTQEYLDRLKVRSLFQPKQGWGPARQLGQQQARGKYILSADADCIYPDDWIQKMSKALMKQGVTCVYGGYSFLAPAGESRWKYFVYEIFRNMIIEIRNIKRPWFNCGGASMGYIREMSLKIGFVDRQIRGEDGRMCFELAQLGKIVRVRDVMVWTSPRSLHKDGTLTGAFLTRFRKESKRLIAYLRKQPVHDTHTSVDTTASSVSEQLAHPGASLSGVNNTVSAGLLQKSGKDNHSITLEEAGPVK